MLTPMPLPTSGKSFNGQAIARRRSAGSGDAEVDQRWSRRWTTTGMYAHQHTTEPGSAFFGAARHDSRRSERQPAVPHLNFFALEQHLRAERHDGHCRPLRLQPASQDFGGNYPRASTRRRSAFPSSFVSALTFNTFPTMTSAATAASATATTDRVARTHVTQTANATISKLRASHTLKFGADYRRIGAEHMAFRPSAGTFSFTQAFTQGRRRTRRAPCG